MWAILALLAATAAFIVFWWKQRHSDFWQKHGVQLLKSEYSMFDIVFGKKHPMHFDIKYYKQLGNSKFGGLIEIGTPLLLVKDLELAKNIFVKDFEFFIDRRDFGQDPVFGESLIFLQGQKWKDMRSFLSPTFTSGKIRRMFEDFEKGGQRLQNYVSTRCPKSKQGGFIVDLPKLVRKYTVDVIGAVAFGFETDVFKQDDDSIFYKMATKTSDINFMRIMRSLIVMYLPKLSNLLNVSMLDKEINEFFINILSQALKERETSTNQKGRHDFLQLLVEAKTDNTKIDESELNQLEKEAQLKNSSKGKLQLTEQMAIAQGFLFFVAGFDTVSNFVNNAVFVLASKPKIQEKLFEEIDNSIKSNGGKITYEGINGMDYLEKYVSEVMRLYPPAQRLERKCIKDYQIPDTNSIIPKGAIVGITAEGIHHDEKYYPDPMTFDPERFNTENKAARNAYAYMPFGIGPRNCIGMRFALIESKVALATLVHHFIIKPTEKTPIHGGIERVAGTYKIPGELEIQLVPRT